MGGGPARPHGRKGARAHRRRAVPRDARSRRGRSSRRSAARRMPDAFRGDGREGPHSARADASAPSVRGPARGGDAPAARVEIRHRGDAAESAGADGAGSTLRRRRHTRRPDATVELDSASAFGSAAFGSAAVDRSGVAPRSADATDDGHARDRAIATASPAPTDASPAAAAHPASASAARTNRRAHPPAAHCAARLDGLRRSRAARGIERGPVDPRARARRKHVAEEARTRPLGGRLAGAARPP